MSRWYYVTPCDPFWVTIRSNSADYIVDYNTRKIKEIRVHGGETIYPNGRHYCE